MLRALLMFLVLLPSAAMGQQEWWSLQDWATDFDRATVPLGEIRDVIGKDNIPAIDHPAFQPAEAETRISGTEPVIAFAHAGSARAYPLRYMMWHEIVNDEVGGLPVAVTYCPLCKSAVVFDRRLDGFPVTFGTTGKLRHSDLIMYDRGEENWWQQFSGEAIVGVRAGERLDTLPSSLISFGQFLARYPDGEVLLPDASRESRAGENPYAFYDTNPTPFLFNGRLPDDIDPMERVAMTMNDAPVAISLSYLKANAPYRAGGHEFTWQAGQNSALDSPTIADGRDVGSIEVFALSPGGQRTPVPYVVTFAFAARAFHPGLDIVQ